MTPPVTRSERHALRADAKNRAWRTLLQGLATDVLVALAAVLLAWLPDADITSGEAWTVIGVTLAKTALTTAASWAMRAKLDASDGAQRDSPELLIEVPQVAWSG